MYVHKTLLGIHIFASICIGNPVFAQSPLQSLGDTLSNATQTVTIDSKLKPTQWRESLQALQDKINSDFLKWRELEILARDTDLKTHGFLVIRNSYQLRSALHDSFSILRHSASTEVSQLSRNLRYIEDILAELFYDVPAIRLTEVEKIFKKDTKDIHTTPTPLLAAAPKHYLAFFKNLESNTILQSYYFIPGDILLTRGVSYLSSMIASLGSKKSQYSHVVFIANDEVPESPLESIESYVGKGVIHWPIKQALEYENSRILWLRPKDRDLGISAAHFMMGIVKVFEGMKKTIRYDYRLDFTNSTYLSCAEIAQYAYSEVSGKKVHLPQNESYLDPKNDVVKLLKVRDHQTFSPGDLEYDDRFELLGEWRDLRLTHDSRIRDLVFEELFDWLETDSDFRKSFTSRGIPFVWLSRKTFFWPLVNKLFKVDFSKEVPARMLRTLYFVNKVGKHLTEKIWELEDLHYVSRQLYLSPDEIRAALNQYKNQDLALYRSKKTRSQSILYREYLKATPN